MANAIKHEFSEHADAALSGTILLTRDVRRVLTEMVEEAGSQREVAGSLGISGAYLGDILHGRRPVSAEMATKLGYERVTVFVRRIDAKEGTG